MLSRSIFCRSAAVTNRVVLRSSESGGPNGVSTTTGLPFSYCLSVHTDKNLLDVHRSSEPGGPNGASTTTGLPFSHWPSAHADKKRKRRTASSLYYA